MASSSSRFFFVLIIVAAAGYLVYSRFIEQKAAEGDPETEVVEAEASEATPVLSTPVPAVAQATPEPARKNLAPPGVFFMTDRVSTTTDDGVFALVPGDRVTLLDRRNDGTLKVTNGRLEFVVKQTQVTQDLDLVKQMLSRRAPAPTQAPVGEPQ